jgi:acyl-CoA dehydrogenase
VVPTAREAETDPHYGERLLAKLGKARLLGLNIPEEYGGVGLPQLDAAMCIEEMARHSLDAAGFMSAAQPRPGVLHLRLRQRGAQAPLPARHLRRQVQRRDRHHRAERRHGVDGADDRAPDRGGRIVLNGRKHYVSNAPCAGVFIIYGRVSGAPRAKGIGAILLERETPGFTIDRLSENMAGPPPGRPAVPGLQRRR